MLRRSRGGGRRSGGARTCDGHPVDCGARGVLHARGRGGRSRCKVDQAPDGKGLQKHEPQPEGLQRDGGAHVVRAEGGGESSPRRRRPRRAPRRTGSHFRVPRRDKRGRHRRRVIPGQQRRQVIRRQRPRRSQRQQRRKPRPVEARGKRRRSLEPSAARGRFHGRGAATARTVGTHRACHIGTSAAAEEDGAKCRLRASRFLGCRGVAVPGAFSHCRTTQSRRGASLHARVTALPRAKHRSHPQPAARAASRRVCLWERAMAGMRGCVAARIPPPATSRACSVALTRFPRPIRHQGGT